MDIPSAVCKRLASLGKGYRYGVAFLPGQGQVAFLSVIVDRAHAGADDASNRYTLQPHVGDLRDRLLRFYDEKGRSVSAGSVPAGKVAVILGFPGQKNQFGNKAIVAGDHAAWLEYQGKPKYAWDQERKEAIRQHGRSLDQYAKDAAADTADFWKYLARDGTSTDPLYTKEEIRAKFKNPENQEFFKTYENADENSFVHDEMVYAGIKE